MDVIEDIKEGLKPGEFLAEPPLPRALTRAQRAFAAAAVIAGEETRNRPIFDPWAVATRGAIIRDAMKGYLYEGKLETLEKRAAEIRERRAIEEQLRKERRR